VTPGVGDFYRAVATPPRAVTASLRAAVEARAAALDQRERTLRRREIEIAERRRVLVEEYRLHRASRQSAAPGPAPERGSAAASPVVPSDGHVRLDLTGAAGTRFDAADAEGFWSRLKRIMLGVSAS
jgi:hypothetical protein